MPLANADQYPLWANALIFAVAAVVVWGAGTRLARYADAIADQTGLGRAFAGMLLLGVVTSLPEVANVVTAADSGNPQLAVNNLLGSASINVLLLAACDAFIGRDAVTAVTANPSTLMLGTSCILLLTVVGALITTGDVLVGGVGAGAVAIGVLSLAAFWLSSGYEQRAPWTVKDGDEAPTPDDEPHERSLTAIVLRTVAAGATILGAGYALSQTGDAIATQTGLGSGIVGFALIGTATSLPELSTIVTALKLGQYDMAFGQVFGTNFINLALVPLGDAVFAGAAILDTLGRFEVVSALLGAALIAIFMIGLLEHRNARVLRMGYDSLAVIGLFAGGLALLYTLR
jgi:cation:H+ antiporter